MKKIFKEIAKSIKNKAEDKRIEKLLKKNRKGKEAFVSVSFIEDFVKISTKIKNREESQKYGPIVLKP